MKIKAKKEANQSKLILLHNKLGFGVVPAVKCVIGYL